mmetsp:Transcript_74127/g.214395  ORF Transcript_74127/g.214395 Transcript_74127/m.214395 type:complete len:313 (-) Transcript_74127:488-1426(-)
MHDSDDGREILGILREGGLKLCAQRVELVGFHAQAHLLQLINVHKVTDDHLRTAVQVSQPLPRGLERILHLIALLFLFQSLGLLDAPCGLLGFPPGAGRGLQAQLLGLQGSGLPRFLGFALLPNLLAVGDHARVVFLRSLDQFADALALGSRDAPRDFRVLALHPPPLLPALGLVEAVQIVILLLRDSERVAPRLEIVPELVKCLDRVDFGVLVAEVRHLGACRPASVPLEDGTEDLEESQAGVPALREGGGDCVIEIEARLIPALLVRVAQDLERLLDEQEMLLLLLRRISHLVRMVHKHQLPVGFLDVLR